MQSQSQIDRITQFGFDRAAAAGLVRAWGDDATAALLGMVPSELRQAGYSAADAVEAVYHDLDYPEVLQYFRHGLTAHQGALIESKETARLNLFAGGPGAADDFLGVAAPRDFLVGVLLVAKSPQEADHLLDRYEAAAQAGDMRAVEVLTGEVRMLAGLVAPALDCPCR
ncbi:hypothetical protein [Nocardioides sp. URHA0032]|uniref:hypothetical protein n=1 Tax=Nocardioides sp. URHA0032 TaxID=1380388 RepID=UPI0012DE899F|nr:hypothetical protein [Nocardioides sp. URHA0032]